MKYSFNAGAVVGDTLYVSDNYCNALLSIDLTTGCTSYVDEFPEEQGNKQFLHKCCLKYKNKLFFVPNMSEHLHIFNCSTGEIKPINIFRSSSTKYVFGGGVIIDGFLWIIPGNKEQPIIKFDLNENKSYILESFDKIVGGIKQSQVQCFWKMCCLDSVIYLPILGTSKIVKYKVDTGGTDIIDTKINNLDSIYLTSIGIILCTRDMKVYGWNPKDNAICEYQLMESGKKSTAFITVESEFGDVFLVPNFDEWIWHYECNYKFTKNNQLYIDNKVFNERRVHFENWDRWRDTIILFPCYGEEILCLENSIVKRIKTADVIDQYYKEKRYKSVREQIKNNTYLREGVHCFLEDYTRAITVE